MDVKINTQTNRIEWFDKPVQIQFYDWRADGRWVGGIGYRNEIICCECGSIISLNDLYDAETLIFEPNPIRFLGDWVDISKYMF